METFRFYRPTDRNVSFDHHWLRFLRPTETFRAIMQTELFCSAGFCFRVAEGNESFARHRNFCETTEVFVQPTETLRSTDGTVSLDGSGSFQTVGSISIYRRKRFSCHRHISFHRWNQFVPTDENVSFKYYRRKHFVLHHRHTRFV